MQSRVNVTNTTYDEVDKWLVAGSNESLAKIQAIGITHKAFRDSKESTRSITGTSTAISSSVGMLKRAG
jgi:hypothetical protein